ncbi:wax ester synthase/diacylglycerol acyltransferase 11-like [Silene latifolia]|uniref:wax ester synthase/diacylglycerol acyltransferase 11-like n=1 Tax=Silene latifolia TaxID=37657 RepID=UPI003D77ED1B
MEEEEPLTPTARLFHAPQINCFIIAVIGCKTMINVNVIKEGLKHTFVKHPRFSSNLVFDPRKGDHPSGWIRTEVNVDDHVITPDLDPNMDSPDQFLEDYVSSLTKTPMDLRASAKPLWEIHLLNIKTKEANSILVSRIHHSVGDGISLVSIVLACTRQTANPDALPTLPVGTNKKKTMTSPSISLWLLSCFLKFMFIFNLLWNTLINLVMFTATALWLKDTKTPVNGGFSVRSTPKRYVYRILRLDDIKLLKTALDAVYIVMRCNSLQGLGFLISKYI